MAYEDLEVLVRRCNDAYVNMDWYSAAYATDLAFLQDTQQLYLKGKRRIANLIEKDCPMIGLLKQANRPMARCASEGAFDVAEEL